MNINATYNSWKENVGFQFISTIYVALLSFIVSVILARELGVEDFGNYSYILSLAGIFLILQDGGYKTLIFRESIDHSAQVLVSSGVFHVLSITLLGMFMVVLIQPERWLTIFFAFGCMSLIVLSNFVSSILKGKGDFKLDAVWKIFIRTLSAVSIFIVLFFFENSSIAYLFIGWSLSILMALSWPILKGYLSWPKYNFKSKLLKSSLVFLTIDVATVFYFRSDIVLLEYYGRREGDVGQYSAAYRLLEGIILLVTPIAMIAFRSLRINITDKLKFFKLCFKLSILMLSAAIFIVLLGALWGVEFMVFTFGSDYLVAGKLLFWLLLAMLFILPNYILTQSAIALNKESSYAKIVILVAISNIGLNILLIPVFGAIGAAWTTIFAEGMLFIGLSLVLFDEWKKS